MVEMLAVAGQSLTEAQLFQVLAALTCFVLLFWSATMWIEARRRRGRDRPPAK